MYSALLLLTLAMVLEEFSYWRGLVWLTLFVDLYFKLRYEETLLVQTFPEYPEYQKHTHQLIPGVF